MLILYHLVEFSNLVYHQGFKYDVGYSCIAVTIVMILFNIGDLIIKLAFGLKVYLKRRKMRKEAVTKMRSSLKMKLNMSGLSKLGIPIKEDEHM